MSIVTNKTTIRRYYEEVLNERKLGLLEEFVVLDHVEHLRARGPNTQVNAACASTTQAIALAEDWIRSGRCRRVIVIGADNVTSDNLLEWVGAGFLALCDGVARLHAVYAAVCAFVRAL